MEKLKIGLFIDTYFPMIDGVVMVVDNYAKRLSEFADVTVFCPMQKDKKYVDNFNYKVVRCKRLKFFGFDYTVPIPKLDRKFKKAVKNANLDIVHIHSPFGVSKMGVKYAKKHNIPVIATLHSQFKQDFYKATKIKWLSNLLTKMVIKVFNKCDVCWPVNKDIQNLYIEDYKLKAPSVVQLNGTEIEYLSNDSYKQDFDKKYNIKPNDKVFLFVGRLNVLKNILFIADALKILKDKGLNFKMLYVGTGADEKLLVQKIEKLGLSDDVILCGKISDRSEIIKFYNRADLFLFPSLYDANSLVQIEAASQKTPTVFLRGAKTACMVTDNVNGFLSEDNTNAYADKILQIINDQNLYNNVSEGAYRDLYNSWNDVIKKAYNDYLELIQKKS